MEAAGDEAPGKVLRSQCHLLTSARREKPGPPSWLGPQNLSTAGSPTFIQTQNAPLGDSQWAEPRQAECLFLDLYTSIYPQLSHLFSLSKVPFPLTFKSPISLHLPLSQLFTQAQPHQNKKQKQEKTKQKKMSCPARSPMLGVMWNQSRVITASRRLSQTDTPTPVMTQAAPSHLTCTRPLTLSSGGNVLSSAPGLDSGRKQVCLSQLAFQRPG